MSIVEFRHSCLGIVERIPQKNRIFCLQHVFHDCHEAYKDVSGSEPMYHVELVISSQERKNLSNSGCLTLFSSYNLKNVYSSE